MSVFGQFFSDLRGFHFSFVRVFVLVPMGYGCVCRTTQIIVDMRRHTLMDGDLTQSYKICICSFRYFFSFLVGNVAWIKTLFRRLLMVIGVPYKADPWVVWVGQPDKVQAKNSDMPL